MAEGAGEQKIIEGDNKNDDNTNDYVSKVIKDYSVAWSQIIGDRDANAMQKETNQALWKVKDRSKLNSRLRAQFIAVLAKCYNEEISRTVNNESNVSIYIMSILRIKYIMYMYICIWQLRQLKVRTMMMIQRMMLRVRVLILR